MIWVGGGRSTERDWAGGLIQTLARACRETSRVRAQDRWAGAFGHHALGHHSPNML